MDPDISRLEEFGVNTELGLDYTGGHDKYIRALRRYYEAYEANRNRITTAYDAMDLEDYTIIVHSLKSNSRMIGAEELSSRFEALEMAARSGDTATIRDETNVVLNFYDALIRRLEFIGEEPDEETADSISAKEASEICCSLLEALDDFDDETSADLVARLSGYSFDPSTRDKLRQAAGYIGEFMYDEAADIIRHISSDIPK